MCTGKRQTHIRNAPSSRTAVTGIGPYKMPASKPVSYTHLDVYKRQGVAVLRVVFAVLVAGELAVDRETERGGFFSVDPVSYTHLDVYKRQA